MYEHNFFVDVLEKIKEEICKKYYPEKEDLEQLNINIQTKFIDNKEDSEIIKSINDVYGVDFYEKNIKLKYINVKTNENVEIVHRIVKNLDKLTKEQKDIIMKNPTFVISVNPKDVRDKFCYGFKEHIEPFYKHYKNKTTGLNGIKKYRDKAIQDEDFEEISTGKTSVIYHYASSFIKYIFSEEGIEKKFVDFCKTRKH